MAETEANETNVATPSQNTSTAVVPAEKDNGPISAVDQNTSATTPDAGSPDTPNDDDIIYPTGLRLALILLALCCAVFLVALDQTIISTAIPKITDQFNSISDIGWYGSSYLLTATALQPTFGKLYRVFDVSLFLP
jgi:hypothetical protein